MTLRKGRAGGDGLSEPPALDPAFRSGKRGAAADCCRLHGVVRQQASPMVRLTSFNECPADRTGQVARGKAVRGRVNLSEADGGVCTSGEGAGVQVLLQDIASSRWRRSWDRGQYP